MNFYEKSLIYNYSTLYDIDFPQKIGFLRLFLRKFLWRFFTLFMGNFIFFNVQSFKYEFLWKILDIQLFNIVRNWFSTKNWIFAIFFKKVSIDGFLHYLWGILFFLMSKVSNMNFYEKSLIFNYSTLYDIDFPQKIGFLRFFLRKFLLTVFNIIYGEYYFF